MARFALVGAAGYLGLKKALPCIEIVSQIRSASPIGLKGDYHPLAKLPLSKHPFGWDDHR